MRIDKIAVLVVLVMGISMMLGINSDFIDRVLSDMSEKD